MFPQSSQKILIRRTRSHSVLLQSWTHDSHDFNLEYGLLSFPRPTWGLPKIRGPRNVDSSILGSILGFPALGRYHIQLMQDSAGAHRNTSIDICLEFCC